MQQHQSDLPPGIGQPALRALKAAGIETLAEAARRSETELASPHGMRPKALGIPKAALAERGAAFRAG